MSVPLSLLNIPTNVLPFRNYFFTCCAFLFFGCVFFSTVTFAQPQYRFDQATLRQADRLIEQFIKDKQVPGLTAAISIDNDVKWARGVGFADKENRVQMVPNTRLRIASISKTITATAAAILYEKGKLDFDAPIQRYLPNYPEAKYPITARQLAGHTAGIRGYRGSEYFSTKQYNNVNEALAIFKADSLLFKPDEKYLYTTYGFVLLSAVVQGAAQQEFRTLLRQRIFEPLYMYDTFPEEQEIAAQQYARYYEKANGRIQRTRFVDNSNKWGGGGLLSTVEDLVRYGSGLLAGKILKKETLDMVFASQKLANGTETGYGIGWARDLHNRQLYIGHTGSAVGASSILVMNPDKKIVLSMICNLQNTSLKDLAYQIMGLFERSFR
jgi:CubicO group peptidase (beta-lactamase class C family)